jgi:dihydrofolate reductase
MEKSNRVYIGTSLDSYIGDKNGGLEFLDSVPIPDGMDMGYDGFMQNIDALVMGRKTFETVLQFDVDWPYTKPVFVLSNTMESIPLSHDDKAFLVKGTLEEVLDQIHQKDCYRLYIDGGVTIQNFLKEDLIDEMIITIIPILIGGGIPLFGELSKTLQFECVNTTLFPNKIVQHHFKRKR